MESAVGMPQDATVELVLHGEIRGAKIEVECKYWNLDEKRIKAINVSDM